ncbi:anti-sigma factor family protein [Pyrinomonas methylaliphatogenes]|jgi:predicted anti-sigma-YlaC factor YlaD|uniref:Putative zinc-finger n=1 Tax=Pyrinomonas methylaliphatogenes TaxID=454194 RepID=A0A0B6WV92_9BACT|nr:zf-HC2 domain-containing protein [Pyrinomonas methylaliphatogenes]MBX5479249.1 zf-HC2 domain-containing protein [Pyrinomonas methylaliphatogenes]CDM65016.1 Putative zinc-finger [Pyrinomonas methylaliphatogenes]
MDCERSLELLSEYHAGTLEDVEMLEIRAHLQVCSPCADVFHDLILIVETARSLCGADTIRYPDEDELWRRLGIANRALH